MGWHQITAARCHLNPQFVHLGALNAGDGIPAHFNSIGEWRIFPGMPVSAGRRDMQPSSPALCRRCHPVVTSLLQSRLKGHCTAVKREVGVDSGWHHGQGAGMPAASSLQMGEGSSTPSSLQDQKAVSPSFDRLTRVLQDDRADRRGRPPVSR